MLTTVPYAEGLLTTNEGRRAHDDFRLDHNSLEIWIVLTDTFLQY